MCGCSYRSSWNSGMREPSAKMKIELIQDIILRLVET